MTRQEQWAKALDAWIKTQRTKHCAGPAGTVPLAEFIGFLRERRASEQ